MDTQLKIAVIADIIASKKVENRSPLQKLLNNILEEINDQYSDNIESNLTITLGDEFQGIIKDFQTAFLIIDLIDTRLKVSTRININEEVTLRWGIGLGELATPINNKKLSTGTDGPSYWNARKAIEEVHAHNDYGKTNERLITNAEEDEFLNSVLRLQNVIRNQWTSSQQETAYILFNEFGYEAIDNRKLKKILNDKLKKNFSEQTISKRIISTHIKQYVYSRIQLSQRIEDWRNHK